MSASAPNEVVSPSPLEFQQMIRDRKAEHKEAAEEKRQNDLRRIQDMKSSTGLDPLDRLPKEIWIMIMNGLEPKEKMHLCQVHEMFRGLMDETYVGDILLPQIMGFEVRHRWLWRENELKFWNANTWTHFALYTKLRLVSKTMRDAVDRWFENDLVAKLNCKQLSKYSSPSLIASFQLVEKDNDHRLRKMLEDPNLEKSLRFFTRSLSFTYPTTTESWDPFNEIASNALLERIGDQIWYFSFEVAGTRFPDWCRMYLEMFYILVLQWLDRMPNLKWISLRLVIDEKNYQFNTSRRDASLPSLNFLERIDLNCNVPQFAQAILLANQKVKVLNFLETDTLNYMDVSDIRAFPVEGFALVKWGGWLNPLQSIACEIWPLKWAHLNIGLPESVFSIYRYLSIYKTLERLSLRFFNTNLGNDITYLELPNLEEFEVLFNKPEITEWNDRVNFFMSFQYLLHARKLKKFSWNCSMLTSDINRTVHNLQEYEQRDGDGKINFEGCWPDLRKSNIFQVFPALNSVRMMLYNVDDKCWSLKRTFHR